MGRRERISDALSSAIDLEHLEVIDESGGHNVPPGSESHFKVVLVSAAFAGQSRLARHRRVNELLDAEFRTGLHALAVHPYTQSEWRERFGTAPLSPPCHGGSAAADAGAGKQGSDRGR